MPQVINNNRFNPQTAGQLQQEQNKMTQEMGQFMMNFKETQRQYDITQQWKMLMEIGKVHERGIVGAMVDQKMGTVEMFKKMGMRGSDAMKSYNRIVEMQDNLTPDVLYNMWLKYAQESGFDDQSILNDVETTYKEYQASQNSTPSGLPQATPFYEGRETFEPGTPGTATSPATQRVDSPAVQRPAGEEARTEVSTRPAEEGEVALTEGTVGDQPTRAYREGVENIRPTTTVGGNLNLEKYAPLSGTAGGEEGENVAVEAKTVAVQVAPNAGGAATDIVHTAMKSWWADRRGWTSDVAKGLSPGGANILVTDERITDPNAQQVIKDYTDAIRYLNGIDDVRNAKPGQYEVPESPEEAARLAAMYRQGGRTNTPEMQAAEEQSAEREADRVQPTIPPKPNITQAVSVSERSAYDPAYKASIIESLPSVSPAAGDRMLVSYGQASERLGNVVSNPEASSAERRRASGQYAAESRKLMNVTRFMELRDSPTGRAEIMNHFTKVVNDPVFLRSMMMTTDAGRNALFAQAVADEQALAYANAEWPDGMSPEQIKYETDRLKMLTAQADLAAKQLANQKAYDELVKQLQITPEMALEEWQMNFQSAATAAGMSEVEARSWGVNKVQEVLENAGELAAMYTIGKVDGTLKDLVVDQYTALYEASKNDRRGLVRGDYDAQIQMLQDTLLSAGFSASVINKENLKRRLVFIRGEAEMNIEPMLQLLGGGAKQQAELATYLAYNLLGGYDQVFGTELAETVAGPGGFVALWQNMNEGRAPVSDAELTTLRSNADSYLSGLNLAD